MTALIGVGGTALVALVGGIIRNRIAKRSDLEVVRIDLETDDEQAPVLDIMVRNRGEAAAVIHELIVAEIEVWSFPRSVRARALPVSRVYDIDLAGDSDQRHRLEQAVPAKGADRFKIRFGTSKLIAPVGGFLYRFRAVLVVDGDRREVALGRYLVRLPPPVRVLGYHGVRGPDPALADLIKRGEALEASVARRVTTVHDRAQAVLDELKEHSPPPTRRVRAMWAAARLLDRIGLR